MNIPDNAFTCDLLVRFADTDMAGHVNNAMYVTYLEIARVEWIKAAPKSSPMKNIPFIVARVEIDYVKPVLLNHEPKVSVWISRIGGKSYDMEYIIHGVENEQEVVYAKARTVQVYFNYKENKSEVIPDEVRELFQDFYHEG